METTSCTPIRLIQFIKACPVPILNFEKKKKKKVSQSTLLGVHGICYTILAQFLTLVYNNL